VGKKKGEKHKGHLPSKLSLRLPDVAVGIEDPRSKELVKDGVEDLTLLIVGLVLDQDVLDAGRLEDDDVVFVHATKVHGVAQNLGEFSQALHLVLSLKNARDVSYDSVDLEREVVRHDGHSFGLSLEFCLLFRL